MNRECTSLNYFNSDNGIYEAFYAEIGKSHTSILLGMRARLVTVLRAILAFFTAAKVRRIARVGFATVALIGIAGVAGALEAGNISPLLCLGLCAVLLAVAYFAIRPAKQKRKGR